MSLSFGYDQYGYRNLVVDSFGNVERSIYNSSGQLLSRVLTVGSEVLRIDQTFDVYGRLETQSRYSDAGGETLVAYTAYVYAADGRLASITPYGQKSEPTQKGLSRVEFESNFRGESGPNQIDLSVFGARARTIPALVRQEGAFRPLRGSNISAVRRDVRG